METFTLILFLVGVSLSVLASLTISKRSKDRSHQQPDNFSTGIESWHFDTSDIPESVHRTTPLDEFPQHHGHHPYDAGGMNHGDFDAGGHHGGGLDGDMGGGHH